MNASRPSPRALSIILPCFNESATVRDCIRGLDMALSRWGAPVEILVVDDGSTDSTAESSTSTSTTHCTTRLLQHPTNLGKTVAIRTGLSASSGRIIAIMDADLQYEAQDLTRLASMVAEGWGGVTGWRVHRQDVLSKRLASTLFNSFVRGMFHMSIHDANSGLKAFKREALLSIVLDGDAHRLLMPLIQIAGYSVTEIPVSHFPRTRGKSKYGFLRLITGSLSVFGLKAQTLFGWRRMRLASRLWRYVHYRVWSRVNPNRSRLGSQGFPTSIRREAEE